jgi:hypothetical protein
MNYLFSFFFFSDSGPGLSASRDIDREVKTRTHLNYILYSVPSYLIFIFFWGGADLNKVPSRTELILVQVDELSGLGTWRMVDSRFRHLHFFFLAIVFVIPFFSSKSPF